MRSTAQINQGSTAVDSALCAIGDSLVDEILLVLAVLEHLEELILGHLEALKRLLLLDDAVGELLQSLLVLVGNHLPVVLLVCDCREQHQVNILSHVGHIIVETWGVLSGGTVAEVASKASLGSLSENVGRRVPEDLLACLVRQLRCPTLGFTIQFSLRGAQSRGARACSSSREVESDPTARRRRGR